MILVSRFLVPKGYSGIALFPFVFVRHASSRFDAQFVNHEKIHLRQQLELLVLPFFVWYMVEFLVRFAQYRHWRLAYRNISFEREAYANESNLIYLKVRSFWNFLKFL
ncbi:MAG TPA: hypothetical protein PKI08_01485 [Aquaticitalea sp.]|nr:hypothetical protein [Aquaticitalea sp.]